MGIRPDEEEDYTSPGTQAGYQTPIRRRSVHDRSPSRSREYRRSVRINPETEEIPHGYSTSPFKSYIPSGSSTSHGKSNTSIYGTSPQASQAYPSSAIPYAPHSTTPGPINSYGTPPYTSGGATSGITTPYTIPYASSAAPHPPSTGTGQAYGTGMSGQELLTPNYGEGRSRSRSSRSSRSPSDSRREEHGSRDRTRERSASSRSGQEPGRNTYEKPRHKNHRLYRDDNDHYSRFKRT